MGAWDLTGTTPASGGRPGERGAEAASDVDGALTVSQAVRRVNETLDLLPPCTVLGEVSGFRGPYGARGHCYFQIKDEHSSMECVIWGSIYQASPYELRNGLMMRFTGSFDVYERTGKLSFQVRTFSPVGEGLLRQQVAALAEKLRREGLMDAARKRPIPAFCTRVAVVTSLSGAVIDDVKRTLRRRNPLVELICVGSRVQGAGAEAELIDALGRAAAITPAPDCILLVRGGGSFEDLMTFNDEALARAVAASPIPVVTGIGHEPDTSICDMVSDRRCSTPTAAAESVAPSIVQLEDVLAGRAERLSVVGAALVSENVRLVDDALERLGRALADQVARRSMALEALAKRPCLTSPDGVVLRRAFELDQTEDRMMRAQERLHERSRAQLAQLALRLPAASTVLAPHERALTHAQERLRRAWRDLCADRAAQLATQAASLDALSPLKVLGRGYAIAASERGIETRAAAFALGDHLRVMLVDGTVEGTVSAVRPGAPVPGAPDA